MSLRYEMRGNINSVNMYFGTGCTKVHTYLNLKERKGNADPSRNYKKKYIRVSVKHKRVCLPWYDYRYSILEILFSLLQMGLSGIEFRRIFDEVNKLTLLWGEFPEYRFFNLEQVWVSLWNLKKRLDQDPSLNLHCNCARCSRSRRIQVLFCIKGELFIFVYVETNISTAGDRSALLIPFIYHIRTERIAH